MHSTGKSLATEATDGRRGDGIGLLVQRHPEVQGALQEVEELPEWQVQERGNDRASVDERDHDVASAVQGMHTEGQHQASRRDRQEQEQRHQVTAKLLRSDRPSVFETPM
jgi:hypothetical protein